MGYEHGCGRHRKLCVRSVTQEWHFNHNFLFIFYLETIIAPIHRNTYYVSKLTKHLHGNPDRFNKIYESIRSFLISISLAQTIMAEGTMAQSKMHYGKQSADRNRKRSNIVTFHFNLLY